MSLSWRRSALAVVLAAGTAAAGLLTAAPAYAQTVASGSVTMVSEPGDYIGAGQSYDYSVAAGDRLTINSNVDNGVVTVSVDGANGDWWYLDFAAPAGQQLLPGVYTGATRYPFNSFAEPGLSVGGNGRGCNTLTGSFTVTEAVYGPNGYVQTFAASFEQHCEGFPEALRGEVRVDNPPAPAGLELGVAVVAGGTVSKVSGRATVSGTVTCSEAVQVWVSGEVTQIVKKTIVNGGLNLSVQCTPGAPVPWQATVTPTGTTPFLSGDAEIRVTAHASDPNYGNEVTVSDVTVVKLRKA